MRTVKTICDKATKELSKLAKDEQNFAEHYKRKVVSLEIQTKEALTKVDSHNTEVDRANTAIENIQRLFGITNK